MYLYNKVVVEDSESNLFKGYMPKYIEELKEVKPLEFKGGKITKNLWDIIKSFMYFSYEKYSSEVQIRLFYNKKTKEWYAEPLYQEIYSLRTEEVKNDDNQKIIEGIIGKGYTPFGTVHHHCDISAFQSGTDHSDEMSQNGLHITLGYMNKDEWDIHLRHILGNVMYDVNLDYWFEENYKEWLTKPVKEKLYPVEWEQRLTDKKPVIREYKFEWGSKIDSVKKSSYYDYYDYYYDYYDYFYGVDFGKKSKTKKQSFKDDDYFMKGVIGDVIELFEELGGVKEYKNDLKNYICHIIQANIIKNKIMGRVYNYRVDMIFENIIKSLDLLDPEIYEKFNEYELGLFIELDLDKIEGGLYG